MTQPPQATARLAPLVLAWLGLVVLTLLSLWLGDWLRGVSWLPLLVAAIVWVKGWLVAYYFLETSLSHVFIRWMTWIFIAFAPIVLVLTDRFGSEIADLLQL